MTICMVGFNVALKYSKTTFITASSEPALSSLLLCVVLQMVFPEVFICYVCREIGMPYYMAQALRIYVFSFAFFL